MEQTPGINEIIEENHFLLLITVTIAPTTATAATTPMIMQRSVLNGVGAEGFFGGGVVEGTEENVMDCDKFFPLMVKLPEDLDTLYPKMLQMVYEYVPLGSENDTVFDADEND